jgi:nicotinamide-nucleotide amidase
MNQARIDSELISIGTEILLGEIVDTNSVYLAKELRDHGINVFYMTSVGDNQQRIADTLRLAMTRSQLIIVCGGLGPTVDDVTRAAVADAVGQQLTFREALMAQIEARFATFRVTMSQNNKRQAYLPEKAIAIENPVGTAPAFMVEYGESGLIVCLPGVPRELKFLVKEKVLPYLRQRYDLGVIKARVLHTAGIGESSLDEKIGTDLLELGNPTIGLAAHNGRVDVRITAKAESVDAALGMIMPIETAVRERVGRWIYGADDERLEQVFEALIAAHGVSVCVIEAGVRGILPEIGELTVHHFFDEPAVLAAYLGLSEFTLRELAEKAAEYWQGSADGGGDVVIAVVCSPNVGEAADQAEGSAVCVRIKGEQRTRVYGFGAKADFLRDWLRTWSTAQAWSMIKDVLGDTNGS